MPSSPPSLPSPWIVQHAGIFCAGALVVDLACGSGRHARWLAARGHPVLALDRDAASLAALEAVPGIRTRCVDLESGAWPLAGERYPAIVVTRYLHRPRLSLIAEALEEDGILLYETFMVGNEAHGRPTNPDFLLRPGELREFADAAGLEVIDFAEGFQAQPTPAVVQAICARRLSAGANRR